MNSIVILGGTILVLLIAYIGYGSWLGKQWGINPKGVSAVSKMDEDVDYATTSPSVLAGHQFSSLAGSAALQGPILGAVFGWVPVVLWLVLGSIFVGGVQNFASMFASVRNQGKTLGNVMEEYIGKGSGKCLLFMAWISVIGLSAFFMDVLMNLLVGSFPADNGQMMQSVFSGTTVMMLLMMMPISIIFGFLGRVGSPVVINTIFCLILMGASFAVSLIYPFYLERNVLLLILAVYLFLAAVLPVWFMVQPRGYLSGYLMIVLLLGTVGVLVLIRPELHMAPFAGLQVEGETLLPYIFAVTAVSVCSGMHSMISSGISSKCVRQEKSIRRISYGSVLLQAFIGVVAILVVGTLEEGWQGYANPLEGFVGALWGLSAQTGIDAQWQIPVSSFIIMAIGAVTLSALDTLIRTGRILLQEIFQGGKEKNILQNVVLTTLMTMLASGVVYYVGHAHLIDISGLFLILIVASVCEGCIVWLRQVGQKYKALFVPLIISLAISAAWIIEIIVSNGKELMDRGLETESMPEIIRIALAVLGAVVVVRTILEGSRAGSNRRKIIFATGNQGKVQEIKRIMGDLNADILSMKDAGIDVDIDENGSTFEENAMIKAKAVADLTGFTVLADDSGLEIDYLNKEPGVYSARYMGEDTPYSVKNAKILERLEGVAKEDRTARFVCAIAAVFPDGRVLTTRSTMEGIIGYEAKGENGFGYDPIFYPDGYDCSSAELDMDEKNKISHRGKALNAMKEKLL